MPWCPKCKNEYKDGFTVCADCGEPLVASLDSVDNTIEFVFGTEEEMTKLCDFLLFGGLDFAQVAEKDANETEGYTLMIHSGDLQRAKELAATYFRQLAKEQSADEDECEIQNEEEGQSTTPFVKASEKAANYKSSASSLLFVSGLLIVLMVCVYLGLLPIQLVKNAEFIVMGTFGFMTVLFLVLGVKSLRDAKRFQAMSADEDKKTAEIHDWFMASFNKDAIDGKLSIDSEDEQMSYYARCDFMKEKIEEQFGKQESSYLEKMIEDLYMEIFES